MDKIIRKIAIGVCHHKDGPFLQDEIFMPIHVGAANSKFRKDEWYRDDSGENISEKNGSFCELTALYWLWKNVDAEFYGLMHYRRFLNFNIGDHGSYSYIDLEKAKNIHGWNLGRFEREIARFDILTSPYWNVHPVGQPNNIMTNREFYARDHFVKDLDVIIDIIRDDNPEIYKSVIEHIYGTTCNFANLAIMNKDIFHRYCDWLFRILFEAEKRVDISDYDKYQKRIWGFIAERLLGGFINHLRRTENPTIGELGVIFLQSRPAVGDRAEVLNNIRIQRAQVRASTIDHVSVVFAIDDNYASHCGAALLSLLTNNTHIPQIDVYVVLGRPLYPENEERMQQISARFPNVDLRFIEVDEREFSVFPDNRAHITKTTYYRLALHRILPESVKQVLYLDADIIVEDKIDSLFLDMDGYCIAAADDEGGVLQSRRLNLPVDHHYFNAGVAVLNLEELRKIDVDTIYLESFLKNRKDITLQDQDILNISFVGRAKRIDLRWNANARLYRVNDLDRAYSDEQAVAAGTAPGIIHFTDVPKPWSPGCRHPLRNVYWHWRNQTPWAQSENEQLDFVEADWSENLKRAGRLLLRKIRRKFRGRRIGSIWGPKLT